MLTQEDDVEIHALAARGWSVSAIARHTGRDRKTVRRYLRGEGGRQRRQPAPSCLEPFRDYIAARFVEDPHVPAVTLLDELAEAGFDRSYPTLVRELRRLELRPVCVVCQQRRGRAPTTEIDHPAGEEIQWDWLELPNTPWGEPAYVLVGALSHSGRFRAVLCEQMTFGHLAGALHEILAGLGGTPRVWRVDRMATAVIAGSDRLAPQFAQLAKHYGSTSRSARRTVRSARASSRPRSATWAAAGGAPPRPARSARRRRRWTPSAPASPTRAAGAARPSANSVPRNRSGPCRRRPTRRGSWSPARPRGRRWSRSTATATASRPPTRAAP